MNKFLDLVLCKAENKKYLCKAPKWSSLKRGDKVVIELVNIQFDAEVVAVCSVQVDSSEMQMILKCADLSLNTLGKVISKVYYHTFVYEEAAE